MMVVNGLALMVFILLHGRTSVDKQVARPYGGPSGGQ